MRLPEMTAKRTRRVLAGGALSMAVAAAGCGNKQQQPETIKPSRAKAAIEHTAQLIRGIQANRQALGATVRVVYNEALEKGPGQAAPQPTETTPQPTTNTSTAQPEVGPGNGPASVTVSGPQSTNHTELAKTQIRDEQVEVPASDGKGVYFFDIYQEKFGVHQPYRTVGVGVSTYVSKHANAAPNFDVQMTIGRSFLSASKGVEVDVSYNLDQAGNANSTYFGSSPAELNSPLTPAIFDTIETDTHFVISDAAVGRPVQRRVFPTILKDDSVG